MCDKHGQEAIDGYMEFNDDHSGFEEAYSEIFRYIVDECYNIEMMMALITSITTPTLASCLCINSIGANNNVFRNI